MAQEPTIAAADRGDAASDETDDPVAERGGLPRLGGDALRSEEADGDLAIGRAVCAAIGSLHHELQAPALLLGHPRVGRRSASIPAAPEADHCLDALKRVVIERDQGGERLFRLASGKEEELRGPIAVEAETVTPLRAISKLADIRKRPGCERQDIRRGREDDDGGVGRSGPEDVLSLGRQGRARREIATPSATGPTGRAERSPPPRSRGLDNAAGRVCDVAGIPRRGPRWARRRNNRTCHARANATYPPSSVPLANDCR